MYFFFALKKKKIRIKSNNIQSDYNRGRDEFSSALEAAGYNLHKGCPDDLFKAMTFTQLEVIVSENGMFPEQAWMYRETRYTHNL